MQTSILVQVGISFQFLVNLMCNLRNNPLFDTAHPRTTGWINAVVCMHVAMERLPVYESDRIDVGFLSPKLVVVMSMWYLDKQL